MLYGAVLVVELCLVVYCVLSILPTPADQVRYLPKLLWLVLVLLFPLAGGLSWLVLGRPKAPPAPAGEVRAAPARPPARPPAPDDDEAFLRGLRERAEQQRRAAEEQRRARDTEPEA